MKSFVIRVGEEGMQILWILRKVNLFINAAI